MRPQWRNAMKSLTLAAASIATLFWCDGAPAQSTGNLLANPDMVLEANDGRTSQTVSGPAGGAPIAFGGTAAADWAFVTLQFGTFSVDTELVPSDLMPGSQMLHVRARGVGFLELRPLLVDSAFAFG